MGQAYGEILAVQTPKNELIENAECQIVIKVLIELKIESFFRLGRNSEHRMKSQIPTVLLILICGDEK